MHPCSKLLLTSTEAPLPNGAHWHQWLSVCRTQSGSNHHIHKQVQQRRDGGAEPMPRGKREAQHSTAGHSSSSSFLPHPSRSSCSEHLHSRTLIHRPHVCVSRDVSPPPPPQASREEGHLSGRLPGGGAEREEWAIGSAAPTTKGEGLCLFTAALRSASQKRHGGNWSWAGPGSGPAYQMDLEGHWRGRTDGGPA
uniref:Uncharacterized protein n=1 Tax=Tetraselmis sp. GSL018 TaxID=582737 RepID=A0A061RX96_9CHLO